MTLFFIIAALLVALCLVWLLLGLFRSGDSSTDQEAVNITLARERRATLEDALANGSIDQPTFDYEREQLEYDLAADLKTESERTPSRSGHVTVAIIVAVFVPLTAGALYLQLGNPAAITQTDRPPQAATGADGQAPALVDLLPQLAARLAAAPDDVNGWRLLGRSYLSVNEFDQARGALERALALEEDDVPTLTQLAEAIAMSREGDLSGESLAYLVRANTLDPDYEPALWLLAIARQQAGDHQSALKGFDRLASLSEDNPDALATIDQMRTRSLQAMDVDAVADADADADADAAASVPPAADPATESIAESKNRTGTEPPSGPGASVQVSVTLSEAASAAVSADDAVFIYARASKGPPMPLAVSRLTVADLPVVVTLDDSMAMVPAMTLSAFPSVTIGARISPSGNPLAQSGDWFAEQNDIPVDQTDNVTLSIDTQTP